MLGKELLLLEFDALPWRIADNDVETAGPACGLVDGEFGTLGDLEHFREDQVQMIEPVLISKAEHGADDPAEGKSVAGLCLRVEGGVD